MDPLFHTLHLGEVSCDLPQASKLVLAIFYVTNLNDNASSSFGTEPLMTWGHRIKKASRKRRSGPAKRKRPHDLVPRIQLITMLKCMLLHIRI